MPTINIGDVLQVIQTWDAPLASVAQNVWHLIMDTGAGADSANILPAVETNQQTAFAFIEDEIANEFQVSLLELRQWDFVLNRFDGIETLVPTGIGGIGISDYTPHGVAALGRVITASARRQGGTFVPGAMDTQIFDGVLQSGFEAGMAAYLAVFDNDITVTGGVFNWCTFNSEPLSPVFETASRAISAVIANSLPSYLSKRKPGVGL